MGDILKKKLILKECSCGKTISNDNGDLQIEKCFVCIEKEQQEEERLIVHKKIMTNLKNKPRKEKAKKKIGDRLEKIAEYVS